MAKAVRHGTKDIVKFIKENFADCSYFQLLRLLAQTQSVSKDVQLRTSLSLYHNSAQVTDFEPISNTIETTILSLYGYNSPMPVNFTVSLLAQVHNASETAQRDFIDILHQYLHEIYLLALAKYKPFFSAVEHNTHDFRRLIYSFAGWRDQNIDASLNSQENKLLFFASLFGRRQKSLVGLKVLIKGLQPSLVFECFSCVEYKISIPVKYRIQLSSSILDNRVMLGNKYYKAGGIVTIHLYELQLQQWQDILNKTNKWQQFFNMLRCYLGCSQLCKVVIYLAAGQASAVKLHDKKTGLGRNSWLLSSANLEYSVLPKKFMLPI
jgi:type VI secretion system ImpH/TssG family protein